MQTNNTNIRLLESSNSTLLALEVNGYRMVQTEFADVLAMDDAGTPCRYFYNIHAPADEPDVFRDRLTAEEIVWMADTDRGPCSAWSQSPQLLAKYLLSLPPNDWPHPLSLGMYRDSVGAI